MRGFPLMNLLILSGLLALLVIPLARVNRALAPARPEAVSGVPLQVPPVPVTVLLRFVEEPQAVSVEVSGKALALRGTGRERQAQGLLDFAGGALEFLIRATWEKAAGPGLVELRVAPDGREEQMQNLWSDGPEAPLEEVARFTWRKIP